MTNEKRVQHKVVDCGAATEVYVDGSQLGVDYQLTVAGNPWGRIVAGNGATIALPTGPLCEDTKFIVRATKVGHPEVQVGLQDSETVIVRPNSGLAVSVRETEIGCNAGTVVYVADSQHGVNYQLLVGGNPVGAAVEGNGSTISLPTGPIFSDTVFIVRAAKVYDTNLAVDLQQTATVTVRPAGSIHTNLSVRVTPSDVNPNGQSMVEIAGSEPGVSYQLMVNGTVVGCTVEGNGGTIALPTGPLASDTNFTILATKVTKTSAALEQQASVAVRPDAQLAVGVAEIVVDYGSDLKVAVASSQVGVRYQLTVGGNPVGTAADGTGGTILLPTGPLSGDATFVIRATSLSNPSISSELQQRPEVTVRPGRQLVVCAARNTVENGGDTEILIESSQPDVRYQLTVNGNPLGQALLGTGAAIALPTGPLTQDTTFVVRASKVADADVWVDLAQSATVVVEDFQQVAVCVADAVIDYGASTHVVVESGQPGVSYQLTIGGHSVGQAVEGSGTNIRLPSGTLREDTTFVVRARSITNPNISTELNAQPSVIVRPDPGLHVRLSP